MTITLPACWSSDACDSSTSSETRYQPPSELSLQTIPPQQLVGVRALALRSLRSDWLAAVTDIVLTVCL